MNSSYNNNINFGDILSTITFLKQPKRIVEIGILDGYSLAKFVKNSSSDVRIDAYDIFDEFNGNHAVKEEVLQKFSNNTNVNIDYGDFYKVWKLYNDKSIDILHIDIANKMDMYTNICFKII